MQGMMACKMAPYMDEATEAPYADPAHTHCAVQALLAGKHLSTPPKDGVVLHTCAL
jgi:hypothetical protein